MSATVTTPNGATVPPSPPPAQETAIIQHEGAINAFGSAPAFEIAQRMAKALSASTMVPAQYQGNLANCMIAIELASRVGCSVFQVMQHLYVVKGRPSWSAAFLIATVNASGRFTPLRFTFVGTKGTPEWGCFAHAKDLASGEELIGTTITMEMVKAEGWGAKWQTMPEQMFRYRAASFWARVYDPGAGMGMSTQEELQDIRPEPIPFRGAVTVIDEPAEHPSAVATEVAMFTAQIAAASSESELKALSKEIAKLPAAVGLELQAVYVARKAELQHPQQVIPSEPKPPAREPGSDDT
jgi:hypothetical protein